MGSWPLQTPTLRAAQLPIRRAARAKIVELAHSPWRVSTSAGGPAARTMHSHITRPRLIVGLTFFLVLFALLPEVAFPAVPQDAGAVVNETSTGPQLLVSEFTDRVSSLWLVDPELPSERQHFLRIEHAAGWEISGAVSPTGATLAYVVLEPGRHDPETEASLYLSTGEAPRLLLERVDLRGGVTWSADGESILVREVRLDSRGARSYTVVEVQASDGRTARHILGEPLDSHPFSLHVVGRPIGGPPYVAIVDGAGTTIVALGSGDGTTMVNKRISASLTRDWKLSPDGTRLAFTEQNGVMMQVRTVAVEAALAAGEGNQPALRAATNAGQTLLDEAKRGPTGSADPTLGSASPVWRTAESLSVGVFRQTAAEGGELLASSIARGNAKIAGSFALPVAWSHDGRFLALRSFEGSGPGSIRGESAVVIDGASLAEIPRKRAANGVGHESQPIPGTHVLILGWWQ